MSLAFRNVTSAPLDNLDVIAPDGTLVGIIGENGSGKSLLLRLAAGMATPTSGSIKASGEVRWLGPDDALNLAPAPVLLIDRTFGHQDLVVRERAAVALDRIRRAGATMLVVSHEEELIRRLADEVWWLHQGKLAGRGDPEEMLAKYRKHAAARVRAWGESVTPPLAPTFRRGGERAVVRVAVRFHEAVADPVVGIMIRTRIGLNVYGTNTELEQLKLGPCNTGNTLELAFAFWCELCPGEYTLTVASHDPDGVWHDWLEDAVAFSVSDSRYTAGVANLHAQVSLLGRS